MDQNLFLLPVSLFQMILFALGALAPDTLPQLTGSDVLIRLLAVFMLITINAFL